jgi:hypothetical protein
VSGYLVKCTATGLDTLLIGPFTALDTAVDFAADPFASRYRQRLGDDTAREIFRLYEREVVKVCEP